jgi:type IV pilus assembly protein PilM
LSAAVAKEFGEPIMVAENRKCESGMVGRGSHFEEPEDPEVARLSKILRNSATRLHAEVARSISFYRSQQGGSAPNRVLLCGGGVFLPLTLEFWQEKLGLPVELFNPLRCIQVDPTQAQELAKLAPRLGELVGLALESVVECPLTLNLIPAAILRRKRLVQQSAAILMAAACVSASLGVWAATTHHATRQARALREELTPRLENLKSLSQKIKQAQEELSLVHKSAAPYEKAVSERDYWVRLIQYIHSCLPEKNIWVTNLEIQEPDLPKNVRGPLRPLPQIPAVKPAPAQSAAPVGAAGPGASSAFPGSATQGTPPSSQPVLLIKGLWLENPSQSRVVQDFGFKLKADSSFFTVPESDKWEIIDKATPTEWAQTFSIPLQLTVAPEKSLQLAP